MAGVTQSSGFTAKSPNGFPRRQRFNQNLDDSISEIQEVGSKKLKLKSGVVGPNGSVASSRNSA